MPGIILGTGNKVVKFTAKITTLKELTSSEKETEN